MMKMAHIRWLFLVPVFFLAACATRGHVQPQYVVPSGMTQASDLFGYSQAVRVGPWVMVSGQGGYDTGTHSFGKTLDKQAALAFKNLASVLKSAGANMNDVVSITTYQTNMKKFSDVVFQRNKAFGRHRPVWTALGVTALALPQLKFEVSAVAYAPRKDK